MQKCRERGWRVPEDVAVIAGRNEETLCEHPRPSLTSVEMGYERVGYEAARVLHQLMEGQQASREPILVPPEGLVVRESTDFFAVEDSLVAAALEFISKNSHRTIGQHDVARAVGAETRRVYAACKDQDPDDIKEINPDPNPGIQPTGDELLVVTIATGIAQLLRKGCMKAIDGGVVEKVRQQPIPVRPVVRPPTKPPSTNPYPKMPVEGIVR